MNWAPTHAAGSHGDAEPRRGALIFDADQPGGIREDG